MLDFTTLGHTNITREVRPYGCPKAFSVCVRARACVCVFWGRGGGLLSQEMVNVIYLFDLI